MRADRSSACRWTAAQAVLATFLLVAAGCSSDPAAGRVTTVECGEVTGRTVDHEVEALEGPARRVLVHLPPCYETTRGDYPTIYLLHGGGGRADMWLDPPVDGAAVSDRLIVDGEIPPVVLVAPGGSAGRPEFTEGEFEVVFADVEQRFRLVRSPSSRAIGGVSAGGPTAAAVAAENPSAEFAALGLFMAVWGPSLQERIPAGLVERKRLPAVLIDIGEDDGLRRYTEDMTSAFSSADIEAEVQVNPGDHDFAFMAERFPDWLRWLAVRID